MGGTEIVKRCDDCRFYETNSDVMSAQCKITGRELELATSSPYRLPAALAVPPLHCPLRSGPVTISVKLGGGI